MKDLPMPIFLLSFTRRNAEMNAYLVEALEVLTTGISSACAL